MPEIVREPRRLEVSLEEDVLYGRDNVRCGFARVLDGDVCERIEAGIYRLREIEIRQTARRLDRVQYAQGAIAMRVEKEHTFAGVDVVHHHALGERTLAGASCTNDVDMAGALELGERDGTT